MFREDLFVFSPTKERTSRQATGQRQAENKEKFNKTAQHNTIQLLEGMGPRVRFHGAARARVGHERGVFKQRGSQEK